MITAYIGIGSNLGDRNKNIAKSLEHLKELDGITVKKTSSIYETEPVGGPSQEKFLNGVIEIETSLLPDELLDRLKGIESRMGRAKTEENGPRILDLDIIFYGDIIIGGGRIRIPHPLMHEREFVLKGLHEIAPDFMHPRFNKTVRQLYEELRGSVNQVPVKNGPEGKQEAAVENNKVPKADAAEQQQVEGAQ